MSAANTTTRVRIIKHFKDLNVPMNAGVSALYRGNYVGSVPLTHTCANMGFVANMKSLGTVKEDRPGVDNIGGTAYPVPIELPYPIDVEYCDNDPNSAIVLATDFMKVAYYLNDHTFTLSANDGQGNTYQKAGKVIDVDSLQGVGVWLEPWLSQIADASLIS